MARINIEDAIYKDMRFMQLVQKTGSVDAALGGLVRAWSLAQAHFLTLDNDRLIPLFEWKRQMIPDAVIEVGLAERREKGIYVCGAETQFAWLIQKQEAGKKSGEIRKKNTTTVVSQEVLKQLNGRSTDVNECSTYVHGPEPLTLTLTHSLTLKEKELKANSRKKREPPPEGISRFIATYAKAWNDRYKSRPDLRGKVQGQIKTFLRDMPLNRSCELIQVYCQMDDPWFVKKCHDFTTFLENIGKVNIAYDTGRQVPTGETKTDYGLEYANLRQALKCFGRYEPRQAREWMGETRWQAVQLLGGWSAFCDLPNDQFTQARAIKSLKEAFSTVPQEVG